MIVALRSQQGSVYLECALLGFTCVIAGAFLVKFHKAFALLLPVGVLVFFLPNLLSLAARLRICRIFRKELAAIRKQGRDGVIVLGNRLRGFDAQAVWLDPQAGEIGFVAAEMQTRIETLKTLQKVQAMCVEKSSAVSFHKGTISIPPRFILAFSFANGFSFKFVTLQKRVMTGWIESLRPYLGKRLEANI